MKGSQLSTTAYYDKNAARWSATKTNSFFHEKQFRKFVSLLKKGNTVLDIGCAYGIHVPLFFGIGQNIKYQGIDVSTSMVRLAKSRYPQYSFQKANIIDRKTLPKKKYEAFWSAATLMHIPESDFDQALTNIEKLMKPHAVGYITLPMERPNPVSKDDPRHFTLYQPSEFKKIVTQRGWYVLKSGSMDGFHQPNIWNWFIVQLP